ncbi:hypothetical protein Tco_0500000 [Tanacetum coccineum]
MQKEKEQQDKLNAVKARLLYGDESGRNLRNHEESHYSESKTPTARTKPRRRHGSKHSRSPSLIASVFRRLRRNRPSSPGPNEGGVFNRLGGKNKAHPQVLTAATRVPKRREPRCNQGSIPHDPIKGNWIDLQVRKTNATFCVLEDDVVEPFTSFSNTLRLLYRSSKLRLSTLGLVLMIKETLDQAEVLMSLILRNLQTVALEYTSAFL